MHSVYAVFLFALASFCGVANSAGEDRDETGGSISDQADSGTLIVDVKGLASDKGSVRFVLFASEEDFMKQAVRAGIVEIEDRQATWVVEDLPYGIYAALVHHDVDGSGKMERHWYGKPKEPTGASNDPRARLGPPRYKDTRFEFDSPNLVLSVTVK